MEAVLRVLLKSSVDSALYATVRLEPMLSCIVAGFLLCNLLGRCTEYQRGLHPV